MRDHAFELGLPPEPRLLSRPAAAGFIRERLFDLGLDGDRRLGDPGRAAVGLAEAFGRAKQAGVSPERYEAQALRPPRGGRQPGAALAAGASAAVEAAERHVALARAYAVVPAPAGGGRVHRLRRPGRAGRPTAGGPPGGPPGAARALPLRARRRVPGHGPGPAAAPPGARRATRQPDGRRRRRPGHLRLPGRGGRGRRSRPSSLAHGHHHHPPAQLPLAPADPGRRRPADRLQRPVRPARPRHAAPAARRPSAGAAAPRHLRGLRDRGGGSGLGRGYPCRPGDRRACRCGRWPSSCAATATRCPSSRRSTGRGWRRGPPAAAACSGGRNAVSCWHSCARPPTPPRPWTCTPSPRPSPTASAGRTSRRCSRWPAGAHRPLWEVLRELIAQPGIVRVAASTRTAVERLVGDIEAACEMAHRRPAPEVLYDHLKRSGRLARLARQPDGDVSVQAVVRLFTVIRDQAAVLPDPRLAFLVPHLDLLTDGPGDDPDDDGPLDAPDAVAVLTAHKAKGLEFSLVVVAGLAEGRFPVRGRAAAFALPPGARGRAARRGAAAGAARGGAAPGVRGHDAGPGRAHPHLVRAGPGRAGRPTVALPGRGARPPARPAPPGRRPGAGPRGPRHAAGRADRAVRPGRRPPRAS